MRRFRLLAFFCEPSLLSGAVAAIGAFIILLAANFSFILRSGLFYTAILGNDSPDGLVNNTRQTFANLNQLTLGNEILNKVLFFAFWMMIGLLAYASIVSLGHVFGDVEKDIKTLGYVHTRKAAIEGRAFMRLALRIAACIGVVLFTLAVARLFLPFSILATRVGLGEITRPSGWLYLLLGYAVLVVCLNVYTVIFRLIVLKARVFND